MTGSSLPPGDGSRIPGAGGPSQLTGNSNGRAQVILLVVVLLIAVVAYARFLLAISDGQYMPAWSDEIGYYVNAKSYAETGSLHGAFLLEENVSRIGEHGAHGFAYSLFHGLIAKVFGVHGLTMILTNIAFLVLGLVLVFVQKFTLTRKFVIVSSILLYFMVPIWLFAYMQETIHMFLGVLVGVLLYRIYRCEDGRCRKAHIAVYLICVAVAMLFRPSWSIATAGLIPLAESRGRRIVYIIGSLVGVFLSFVYASLFLAAYPYGFMVKAAAVLQEGQVFRFIWLLLRNFGANIAKFFFDAPFWPAPGVSEAAVDGSRITISYFLSKYLLVGLSAFCLWVGFRKKDRFALAAGLVASVTILMVLVFYDAFDWREHRSLAAMFMLLLIPAAAYRGIGRVVPLLLLLLFPQVVNFTSNCIISVHRRVAVEYDRNPEVVRAFDNLRWQITESRLTTVLYSRDFWQMAGINHLAMPLTNAGGYPIRYTVNLRGGPDLAMKKPGFVDYILVPETVQDPDGEARFNLRLIKVE